MEYRELGRSGLTVSVAGLGCNNFGWRLGPDESAAVVRTALDCGVTFFDTANVYGAPVGAGLSEEYLGQALRGHRDGVVLATKFGMSMQGIDGELAMHEAPASRRAVRTAVESSLRRLQTDRIDLYQLHQPDPRTPIDETLAALDDLVRDGKILYVGAGGRQMSAWHFADAWWTSTSRGLAPFVSAQVEWSLVERKNEAGIIEACEHYGMSVLPFFPLAAGLLSGKYGSGAPVPAGSRMELPVYAALLSEANLAVVERLTEIATSVGASLLEVALGWLADHRIVGSVMTGARTPDQVRANVAAVAWRPDARTRTLIDDATTTNA